MKLKLFMLGALAALAVAACTKDNAPAGTTPGGDEVTVAGASYLKVNFVTPGKLTTRADAEGDAFEYGTDAENAVTSGTLFFFDGTTQVADPFDLSSLTWDGETTPSIEKASGIVVVLENPLKNPTSVVAVLNASLDELGLSKSSTLDEIKAVVKDFATEKTTEGKFVMSSSAYDGAENDVAAKIETVYDTREAAEAAPSVKVPVERVVAKVDVQEKADGATMTANTINIDGKEATVTATIDGWWFDNAASTSKLLKDITGLEAADNDAANFRSYWAKPVPGTLKHGALKDAKTGAQYVQENVGEAEKDEDGNVTFKNATQVVVAATLKVDNKAVALVKYLGTYYTEAGFATKAINIEAQTYYTKAEGETTTYTTVGENDLEVTFTDEVPSGITLKSYEAYAKVEPKDASTKFYVKDATAEDGFKAVDNPTFGAYVVQRWEDGQTYYFVPIKHDADRAGVIRNHVYKLTVNSINGLGTPIPFKDVKEIIPEIPVETETYISAEIDILAWKIVKQDVDLGK